MNRQELIKLLQQYLGMNPRDKGCSNWNEMQQKLADEIMILDNLPEQSTPETFEYEMFFKSEVDDKIKMDGWIPISTNFIRNPLKINNYIKRGLLRKISKIAT